MAARHCDLCRQPVELGHDRCKDCEKTREPFRIEQFSTLLQRIKLPPGYRANMTIHGGDFIFRLFHTNQQNSDQAHLPEHTRDRAEIVRTERVPITQFGRLPGAGMAQRMEYVLRRMFIGLNDHEWQEWASLDGRYFHDPHQVGRSIYRDGGSPTPEPLPEAQDDAERIKQLLLSVFSA